MTEMLSYAMRRALIGLALNELRKLIEEDPAKAVDWIDLVGAPDERGRAQAATDAAMWENAAGQNLLRAEAAEDRADKLERQVEELKHEVRRLTIKKVTIIPWEPGELGVNIEYADGQHNAKPREYLPNCRTKEHLDIEARANKALEVLRGISEKRPGWVWLEREIKALETWPATPEAASDA